MTNAATAAKIPAERLEAKATGAAKALAKAQTRHAMAVAHADRLRQERKEFLKASAPQPTLSALLLEESRSYWVVPKKNARRLDT